MNEIELAEEIERLAESERSTGESMIWVLIPTPTATEVNVINEALRRMGLRSRAFGAAGAEVQ